MGTVRKYACSHCHFCHEGLDRVDALMAGPTFKVICHDCQALHYVSREVVGLKKGATGFRRLKTLSVRRARTTGLNCGPRIGHVRSAGNQWTRER